MNVAACAVERRRKVNVRSSMRVLVGRNIVGVLVGYSYGLQPLWVLYSGL